jgi:thiosulfate/3-mercaptopyruvate sulfurtransferase
VDGSIPAVVYDDGRMTEAARVWFILQYVGTEARMPNGGLPAVAGSENLLRTARRTDAQLTFRARPGSGPAGLIDRHGLKDGLDGDIRIFDARTAGEFAGEDLRRNARGGHLPGARSLPHASLLDHGRLKPADDLRDLLAGAGFQPGDDVVTHCDGGGRAALAAAAALRAGYEDVRAYYLSFADWAKDESCPIVRDLRGPTLRWSKPMAVNVRYIVDDVDRAIAFYTGHLGFSVAGHPAPGFAILSKGDLRLLVNAAGGPGGAARVVRPSPCPMDASPYPVVGIGSRSSRRPRGRGCRPARGRRPFPQRARDRRQADPARGSGRQSDRALPGTKEVRNGRNRRRPPAHGEACSGCRQETSR